MASRHSSSRLSHSSSSSSSSRPVVESTVWQAKLEGVCRQYGIATPEFQIVSDKRGGRTAWSSRLVIFGQMVAARYWYDGNNVNNAKEDAAEVALGWIQQATTAATTTVSPPSSSRNVAGW